MTIKLTNTNGRRSEKRQGNWGTLEDRNIVQVSINMVNYEKTALYRAFEMVKMEAKRYGVNIIGSEIVGLTPMKALIDVAEYYLQLENFDFNKQILENYLLQ